MTLPINNSRKWGWALLLVIVGLVVSAPSSHANFKRFQKISDTQGTFSAVLDDADDLGESVTAIGDLDLDGIPDMAISAEGDDDNGIDKGAVYILFMRRDGTVRTYQKISEIRGGFTGDLDPGDEFGNWITSIGDLNGDGIVDLAVSARGDDDGGPDRGAIWILFLNRNGTVKGHQKISDTRGGFLGIIRDRGCFGCALEGLGDFDKDGIPDLAAGAQNDDDGGNNKGAVWLLMLKADGTVKRHMKISDTAGGFIGGLDPSDQFGHAVSNIGDFDGNGVTDIAVGAQLDDDGGLNAGAVWLLMLNANGTVNHEYKISATAGDFSGGLDAGDDFGQSVENLGDLDGDGVIDLAVGAEYDTDGGLQRGATWILYMNRNGTVKNHFKINFETPGFTGQLDRFDEFGQDIAAIGDLDGDGVTEMVVTADGDDDGGPSRGAAYVFFLDARLTNQPPVLASIGPKTVVEGQQLRFDVSAGDPDGPPPLVLKASGTPLNRGAVFTDNGTGVGTFTWTPAIGDALDSPYQVTFSATENGGAGLRDDETIAITVNPIGSILLESGRVGNVDENWVTVSLKNAYRSPVVVASPTYDNKSAPRVVRIRNAGSGNFEMRAVNVNNPDADVSGIEITYMVVEEGVYTAAAHGMKMEARRYLSTVTDRQGSWVGQRRTYSNAYANPVVLGQVMSENDAAFSVFWCRGATAEAPPTSAALFTGKHVGEDPKTARADETVGYIVMEEGVYTLGGVELAAGLGPLTVAGVDNAPPYGYSVGGITGATRAVVSQAGMRGGNGGWAVLYGANPVSDTLINLAIDEDQLRDVERSHNPEQVGYVMIRPTINLPPAWDPVDTKRIAENQLLSVDVHASDPDGPAPLVLTAVGLPAGASFTDNGDGSGNLLWTPTVGDAARSPYQVTFTATEGNGIGQATDLTVTLIVTPQSVAVPMETGRLIAVNDLWTTVTLDYVYASPVVVAAVNIDGTSPPLVVRVRNVTASSFDLRVVNVNDPALPVVGADVTYLVVEEGVYNQAAHGVKMEARRYQSTVTDRQGSWVGQPQTYANSYSNPVVLGQVMSENDVDFSVFWSRGASQGTAPSGSTLFTGKHVGEDPDTTRADETIGYVVVESGAYTVNGNDMVAGVGPVSVSGVGNAPPYNYAIGGITGATGAVVSQAGMRGGNGGWAVLYGANPVSDTSIGLAIDEDQLLDLERSHNPEQVAYLVF